MCVTCVWYSSYYVLLLTTKCQALLVLSAYCLLCFCYLLRVACCCVLCMIVRWVLLGTCPSSLVPRCAAAVERWLPAAAAVPTAICDLLCAVVEHVACGMWYIYRHPALPPFSNEHTLVQCPLFE
jgi:hypothetical protein